METTRFTLGIEEEFQLVNLQTGELEFVRTPLLRRARTRWGSNSNRKCHNRR